MTTKHQPGTAGRILDVAERLVQVRGFNAFSYADVAKAVGVRKASLHHHFATKTDLGVALIGRYRRDFLDALEAIDARGEDAVDGLERYIGLYRSVLRNRRMCMCGMLAADVATLPAPMRAGVAEFFAENQAWLSRILTAGRKRGELGFRSSAASMAAFIVSSLEGGMLVSRGTGEMEHLDEVAELLLRSVEPKPTGSHRRKAAR